MSWDLAEPTVLQLDFRLTHCIALLGSMEMGKTGICFISAWDSPWCKGCGAELDPDAHWGCIQAGDWERSWQSGGSGMCLPAETLGGCGVSLQGTRSLLSWSQAKLSVLVWGSLQALQRLWLCCLCEDLWPGSGAALHICSVMWSMGFPPAVINKGIWWAGKDSPDGSLLLLSPPGTICTEEIPWIYTRVPWTAHIQKALARNIPCRQTWNQGFSSSRWGSTHCLLLHCWDLRQEKGPLEEGMGLLVSMIISKWPPGRSSKFIFAGIVTFLQMKEILCGKAAEKFAISAWIKAVCIFSSTEDSKITNDLKKANKAKVLAIPSQVRTLSILEMIKHLV